MVHSTPFSKLKDSDLMSSSRPTYLSEKGYLNHTWWGVMTGRLSAKLKINERLL